MCNVLHANAFNGTFCAFRFHSFVARIIFFSSLSICFGVVLLSACLISITCARDSWTRLQVIKYGNFNEFDSVHDNFQGKAFFVSNVNGFAPELNRMSTVARNDNNMTCDFNKRKKNYKYVDDTIIAASSLCPFFLTQYPFQSAEGPDTENCLKHLFKKN